MKKGGWVGDEALSISMRGNVSIKKKSLVLFDIQHVIGKVRKTPCMC